MLAMFALGVDRHLPVVHGRSRRHAQGHRRQHRPHGAEHRVDPAARRLPAVTLEGCPTATDLVVAVIALTFVYDTAAFLVRLGVGRLVLPAAAGARRQPEEVGRGPGRSGAADHRDRVGGPRAASSSNLSRDKRHRGVAAGDRGRGRRDARRPRGIARSSATSASRTWAACCRATAACSTGSTRCCSSPPPRSCCSASSSPEAGAPGGSGSRRCRVPGVGL